MIITLTTDFGLQDGYVAAMKGVIYSLAPRATLVDLCHLVPPFDVQAASFVLYQAAPYYPPGTVHVVVVDPGVGSSRRGLALVSGQHIFIGPDNGVFTAFINENAAVRQLDNPDLWLPEHSATFHGRDLFAPVAVHLAQGLPLAECGAEVADPVRLPAWEVHHDGDEFAAVVVHIDRFGNAITGLPAVRLAELGLGPYSAHLPGRPPIPVLKTYAEAKKGKVLALAGSTGLLELAVREAAAAEILRLERGAPVRFSA